MLSLGKCGHKATTLEDQWVDELDLLAQMQYDRKKWGEWWGPSEDISSREFEAAWRVAESFPLRSMQLDGELMCEYGDLPPWLEKSRTGTRGS
jgi:hypothetical protein